MLARLLHLVRYDLTSVAPILGVWFGVLALESLVLWMGPPIPMPDTRDPVSLDIAMIVVRMAVTVVLTSGLVHRHPLVGTSSFWRTKPVPRWSLVMSKLATTGLLAVGVPFAWFSATFLASGLDTWTAVRAAGFMAGEQAVVAAVALALAAVSSNLAQVVVGGVATMLLFTTGLELLARPRPRVALPFVVHVSADTVEIALAITVAVVFALAAVHQYATLRTRRTITGLAFIVLGYVLLLRYPVWRVVEAPVAAAPADTIAAPDLTIDRASMRSEHFVRLDERGRTTGVRYYAQVKDAGPSGAVILAPRAFATTLTFPDGAVERYASPPGSLFSPGTFPDATLADQPYASLGAALNASLLADPRDIAGQRYGLTFLEVSDTAFGTRGRTAATMEMAMEAVAHRYSAAVRLPLAPGARAAGGDSAYTFNRRDPATDRVALDVREAAFRDWTSVAPTRYVLHNTARREALVLVSARERTFHTTLMLYRGLLLVRRILEAQLIDRPSLDAVDEAWLAQAELVVAMPEILGSVDRTIRLDDFVLDPSSGVPADPAGALTPPGGGK